VHRRPGIRGTQIKSSVRMKPPPPTNAGNLHGTNARHVEVWAPIRTSAGRDIQSQKSTGLVIPIPSHPSSCTVPGAYHSSTQKLYGLLTHRVRRRRADRLQIQLEAHRMARSLPPEKKNDSGHYPYDRAEAGRTLVSCRSILHMTK
jgi:hypothetical protein